MAEWFRESGFQKHLLTFLCRDRNFLKACGGLLSPKDFRPGRDETDERLLVATLALDFWKKYKAPIGDLLRTNVSDFCHKNHVEGDRKKAVNKLVDKINNTERLPAVQAIEDRVREYITDKTIERSIEELITKKEDGELTQEEFLKICKTVIEFSNKDKLQAIAYKGGNDLENRIARREISRKDSRPLLMLPGFDSKTRGIGRGDLGVIVALYKKGKSLALAHLADAYAKQGLNVLFITLEDPKEEVEDRMDASLAYMPIEKLAYMPNKLRKRHRKFSRRIQGKIKIVDATTDKVSVADIDELWETQRDQGWAADVIIVDYDDEIIPPRSLKGESARRFEFADIYRELRRMASKRQCIVWTAAQTKGMKDNTKIITPEMLAEDKSKARKVTLFIGVGQGESHDDARYCYVALYKRGKARFGWEQMASPDKGVFFDESRTAGMKTKERKKEE